MRISNSAKKHIRKEKARLGKIVLSPEELKNKIAELYAPYAPGKGGESGKK